MSDDGSTFPTAPVTQNQGRPPLLVAGLVVALVVGSIAIARLSPPPERVPPVEPTIALPTPLPSEPVAAELPLREWFSAPAAPISDVLVEMDGVRWLRLASARLTEPLAIEAGRDLLLRTNRDGLVCLCWSSAGPAGSGNGGGDPRRLELVRIDDVLRVRSRVVVTEVDHPGGANSLLGPSMVAIEPAPDGRSAYLARARRSDSSWQVVVDWIDTSTGEILDELALDPTVGGLTGTAGPAAPGPVRAVALPLLRVAPDGGHLLLVSGVDREARPGPPDVRRQAWVVEVEEGRFGSARATDGFAEVGSNRCGWAAFVSDEVVAAGCARPDSLAGYEVKRWDLGGRPLGPTVSQPQTDDPLIDATDGIGYAWNPAANVLRAADLGGDGRQAASSSDQSVDNPADVELLGPRPEPGEPVSLATGQAAVDVSRPTTLVASPDGRLLFAIGSGPRDGSSSGIWVFDARTLALVERWPALASYDSITLFEGGRWLAATGRPGVTASGGPAVWDRTVTIHDMSTGRPVLRLGHVGTDDAMTFPTLGLIADRR